MSQSVLKWLKKKKETATKHRSNRKTSAEVPGRGPPYPPSPLGFWILNVRTSTRMCPDTSSTVTNTFDSRQI